MRRLLVLLALCVSFNAMAKHHFWAFEGEGQWISADGQSGHYNVHVEGDVAGDRMTITEVYHMEGQEHMVTLDLIKKPHGFADIMMHGEKIGEGYCFKAGHKKTCHMNYSYDGKHVEKTCHKDGDTVLRMGSFKAEGYAYTKFFDHMKAVRPDQNQQNDQHQH